VSDSSRPNDGDKSLMHDDARVPGFKSDNSLDTGSEIHLRTLVIDHPTSASCPRISSALSRPVASRRWPHRSPSSRGACRCTLCRLPCSTACKSDRSKMLLMPSQRASLNPSSHRSTSHRQQMVHSDVKRVRELASKRSRSNARTSRATGTDTMQRRS